MEAFADSPGLGTLPSQADDYEEASRRVQQPYASSGNLSPAIICSGDREAAGGLVTNRAVSDIEGCVRGIRGHCNWMSKSSDRPQRD